MKWLKLSKRKLREKFYQKKAFTLIETIIVIAIIGILVMLGTPKFKNYVEQAKLTQIKSDIKTVESVLLADRTDKTVNDKDIDGSLADNHLDKIELILKDSKDLTDKVTNKGFIQIKEDFIKNNTNIKKNTDKFYFNKDTNEVGFLHEGGKSNKEEDVYLATSADFKFVEDRLGYDVEGKGKGYFHYKGDKEIVQIPNMIGKHEVTSCYKMFSKTSVRKVISTNENISSLRWMFESSNAEEVNLSNFNTSSLKDMLGMFQNAKTERVVFGDSFDTSDVIVMSYMFCDSKIKKIDLLNFETSKVEDTQSMFENTVNLEEINLSSFNFSNIKYLTNMFNNTAARICYINPLEDTNELSDPITGAPDILKFIKKQHT